MNGYLQISIGIIWWILVTPTVQIAGLTLLLGPEAAKVERESWYQIAGVVGGRCAATMMIVLGLVGLGAAGAVDREVTGPLVVAAALVGIVASAVAQWLGRAKPEKIAHASGLEQADEERDG